MLKEFIGIGGYARTPEGFLSWQHLTFVTSLMVCMFVMAAVFGIRRRSGTPQARSRVLAVSAILMDGIEILKIIILCAVNRSWSPVLNELPLYMCSIQLITLPLAAFSRGRIREAAIDFVCIFGIIGALLGTYGAGQNYNAYPVISFENVISGITHSIAGFASVYIMFSGMAGMKKRDLPVTCGIILAFSVAAYIANLLLDTNYMFLRRGDGTPYDILYNLVSGNAVLYPLGVVALFMLYIAVFYSVFRGISIRKARKTDI